MDGFTIEGTARHAMRIGGKYIDEYHMSKIYPEEV
jgi:RimJ/RimL family protein N-acetyltransferase